ncbi:hypothetical protein N782_13455 [Pontibacillus yanchengensis Y32]|uniref:Uncharacterized protein n=1 Tax=Pontibacillus yanchengensis Y32 TaxID=1385514 RepID=A0A0A2TDY3_9BACI|nr:hypothetical protein N782_13455 [Pontibacillus yanchengensis Y32]
MQSGLFNIRGIILNTWIRDIMCERNVSVAFDSIKVAWEQLASCRRAGKLPSGKTPSGDLAYLFLRRESRRSQATFAIVGRNRNIA